MKYTIQKRIVSEDGKVFCVGDTVSVRYSKSSGFEGGGFGSATITKITDTGFQYRHGDRRTKSVQFKNIEEIY